MIPNGSTFKPFKINIPLQTNSYEIESFFANLILKGVKNDKKGRFFS